MRSKKCRCAKHGVYKTLTTDTLDISAVKRESMITLIKLWHYGRPKEVIKEERSNPSYSSSGRSSNAASRFFCEIGLFDSFAFLAAMAASSSSVVRLKRSRTWSVSMDDRPEFCWVTTE